MKKDVTWKATLKFADYTQEEIFNWFREGNWLNGNRPVKITLEFDEDQPKKV